MRSVAESAVIASFAMGEHHRTTTGKLVLLARASIQAKACGKLGSEVFVAFYLGLFMICREKRQDRRERRSAFAG